MIAGGYADPRQTPSRRMQRVRERAERARKAVELANEGKTPVQIAAAMECSVATVRHYLADAMATVPTDELQALRAAEGVKLDWLWREARRNVMEAEAGVPRATAIGAAIKVVERRVKLFGLDAPEKQAIVATHTHKHTLEPTPEATAALVAAEIRTNPAFAAALRAESERLDALEAEKRAIEAPSEP